MWIQVTVSKLWHLEASKNGPKFMSEHGAGVFIESHNYCAYTLVTSNGSELVYWELYVWCGNLLQRFSSPKDLNQSYMLIHSEKQCWLLSSIGVALHVEKILVELILV